MSTLMEDRLSTALRARADQVQPEDLGPVEVPVQGALPRRPVLLGLAAAAAVAAVVVPFATGGPSGGPRPAPPASQGPADPDVNRQDVDGDGRLDHVSIDYEQSEGTYDVVVDLAGGDTLRNGGRAETMPELLPAVDLDGNGGSDVVLRVDGRPWGMPAVYTWLEREGLVRAPFPEEETNGWLPGSAQNRWAVRGDRLATWEILGDEQAPLEQVAFWTWRLSADGRLTPGTMGTRCLPEGVDHPVDCDGEIGAGIEVGPRGDLPRMFPAVEEQAGIGEPVRFSYGSFELRGDVPDGQDSVEAGEVELVVTLSGTENVAPIPAGWTPRLSVQPVAGRGDSPGFLVVQEGGDSSTMTVYSFWNGKLQPLGLPSGVPFGSGFSGGEEETLPFRTWITEDGALFTAEEVDPGTGLHRVFTWSDDLGDTLTERYLGDVCIDWLSSPTAYGRCP